MTRDDEGRNCYRHRRCDRRDPRRSHDGGHLPCGVPQHARDDPRVRRDVRRHPGRVRHGRDEEDPGVSTRSPSRAPSTTWPPRSTSSSRFAEKARKDGLLALESDLEEIDDAFTKKGMQLVVDGTDPDLVREILEVEVDAMAARHKEGAEVFKTAGGFAPTMGIIGTVMGLVHVLQHLSAPETLGPSISGAFIATLMGVGAANVVFLPVATPPEGPVARRAPRAQPGPRGHPLDPGRRQPARRVREADEPRAARRAPLGRGGRQAEPAPRRCSPAPTPPRRPRSPWPATAVAGAWAPTRRPRRATSAGCSPTRT